MRRRQRGSAYVLVLAIALLVSVIGFTAITAVRVQLRTVTDSGNSEEARLLAQSGAEVARNWINSDTNWRKTRASGDTATLSVNGGTISFTMIDPADGNFANSPFDPVTITAVGYKGRARQKLQLTLTPVTTGYTCLNASIASAGSMAFTSGIVTGGTVATNANMVLSGSTKIYSNAEASGSITGTSFFASKISGVPARQMPDASAFDYYIENGTAISWASTGGIIDKVLLSPANNPYGPTNANGIYVINCADKKIAIKNSRIVGTLVLLNTKTDSVIENAVSLEPYVANFPTLMVKGSITFDFDGSLQESTILRNLNPPGSPYNGVSNATSTDTYPSRLYGLAYISGNLVGITRDIVLNGPVVVGGTCWSDHGINATYDARFLNNPPPGFFGPPPMKVSGMSWAQVVD